MISPGGGHARTRAGARGPGAAGERERGAVTAELALALPAVVLVLAAVLVTASAATAQMRCADAARAGARAASAGESAAVVIETAERVAGRAVAVRVRPAGSWVEVEVTSGVDGSWLTSTGLRASATATAWREP